MFPLLAQYGPEVAHRCTVTDDATFPESLIYSKPDNAERKSCTVKLSVKRGQEIYPFAGFRREQSPVLYIHLRRVISKHGKKLGFPGFPSKIIGRLARNNAARGCSDARGPQQSVILKLSRP